MERKEKKGRGNDFVCPLYVFSSNFPSPFRVDILCVSQFLVVVVIETKSASAVNRGRGEGRAGALGCLAISSLTRRGRAGGGGGGRGRGGGGGGGELLAVFIRGKEGGGQLFMFKREK